MTARPRAPIGARVAPVRAEVRPLPLAPQPVATRPVEPPTVRTAAVVLAPSGGVVELTDPDPPVVVVTEVLRPGVDVLPAAFPAAPPVLQERDLGVRAGDVRVGSLLSAEILRARAALVAPDVRRAEPDVLFEMRVGPTPPARITPDRLRRCLTALVRRSGPAGAADLVLVGVFDRVPGGAVQAVTAIEGGVRLRLTRAVRPRPATLVVGRRRSTGALVTVELPASAGGPAA